MRRLLHSIKSRTDELVLAFIAFFLFFVATNTQTGWLFVVSSLIGGVLAVSFFSSRATLKGLRVRALASAPVFAGQTARLRLEIDNPLPRTRRFLTVSAGETPVLIDSIPARGRVLAEVEVACPRRGAFPVPPIQLYSATPFGLFGVTRVQRPEGELVVYPRGPLLEQTGLMQTAPRRAYSARTHNRAGSSYDLRRIRPYEPGEDIRAVHWPLTARTGQLMIREHQETSARRLSLVLLNGSASATGGEPPPLELAIEAAASLVELGLRQGLAVRLMAARRGQLAESSGSQGHTHYELLARLTAEAMDGSEILRLAAEKAEPQGSLLILAASPLGQQGWEEARRKRLGLTVLAFHPGPHAFPANVTLRRVQPGDDLLEVLSRR
ncbi:MAG: hypothetical protein AMXMBFR33_56500 [Candidatus Xenobia bacterium]